MARVAHAVTLLAQTVLNTIAFGRMAFMIENPDQTTRILWGVYAVVLVFNAAVSLSSRRR